jgi:UMF1 family MFS transporter
MRPDSRAATAWCLYDWANSAFATVVLSAVLPVYFAAIAPPEGILLAGRAVPATAVWGYTVALSMLLVAVVAPTLGNLADRHALKKPLLIFCAAVGSCATALLYFAGNGAWLLAAGLFLIANIGFAAGNIFYKATTLLAKGMLAAVVTGAPFPAILTSRADDDDSKYYSIVLAAALV